MENQTSVIKENEDVNEEVDGPAQPSPKNEEDPNEVNGNVSSTIKIFKRD